MNAPRPHYQAKGVRVLKKVSVPEFAKLMGVNESTVRKHIRAGKVNAIEETFNNRKVYKILLDDNDPVLNQYTTAHNTVQNENVQDVEIIDETTNYQIVSMEKDSFDNLIDKFEKMSQDRAESLETTLESVRAELFEVRAEFKKTSEELTNEKIKAAQMEAESKIYMMRVKELEEKLNNLLPDIQKQNDVLTKKIMQAETELHTRELTISDLRRQLSNQEQIEVENKTLKEELKNTKYALTDIEKQMQDIVVQKADLQGDLEDERELVKRLEKQNNSAIEEAQEFEKENYELKEQLNKLKKTSWRFWE